jgi:hypothetical protein
MVRRARAKLRNKGIIIDNVTFNNGNYTEHSNNETDVMQTKSNDEIFERKDKDDVTELTSISTECNDFDILLQRYNINLDTFEILEKTIRKEVKTHIYRDQNLVWHSDGHITGHAIRKPNFITKPVYHIKIKLRKKKEVIDAREAIADFIKEMKRYSPKKFKIYHPEKESYNSGLFLELLIFDFHFGRLCWWAETGANYDIKVASKMFSNCIDYFISRIIDKKLDEIVLPIGNDFFNVNSMLNATAKGGIPQDEDARWPKTFTAGRELVQNQIEKLRQIAPVRVVIVPGNHETERIFFLGECLACWFKNNQDVIVDNSPTNRKYYRRGQVLIGYTHGSEEKRSRLRSLMTEEQKTNWAVTKFREWHTGHYHSNMMEDMGGVIWRMIPTLVPLNEWEKRKGFMSLRQVPAFLWHKDKGLDAQYFWHP